MRTVRTAAVLSVAAFSGSCQLDSDCESVIRSHIWATALTHPTHCVQVYQDPGAVLPWVLLAAPQPPKRTYLLLHGDPGGKEVWAQLAVGPMRRGATDCPPELQQHAAPGPAGWRGLAEDNDVLVIDLPSHGLATNDTRVSDPDETGSQVADAVHRILADRPLRAPLVVVGHSFGGEVACRMVARSLLRPPVERLVLVDAVGFPRLKEEIQASEQTQASWFVGGFVGALVDAPQSMVESGLADLYFDRALIQQNQVAPLYRAYTNHRDNYRAGREITLRDLARGQRERQQAADLASRVRCPTLLVWGAQDPAWTVDTQAVQFLRALPDARLVLIRRCGHLPPEERPDILAGVLRSWIEATPPAAVIAAELVGGGYCDPWFTQNRRGGAGATSRP